MLNWSEIPRFQLGNWPTKIEYLEHLSHELKGPAIYMKRDDETGLAFGGNKVRKLEFIIADAKKQGADVMITSGGVQTNHGRLAAAASVKAGIKPLLVLTNDEPEGYSGNLLLDKLLGAEIHFVSSKNPNLSKQEKHNESRMLGEQKVAKLKNQYEKSGKKVYVIPRGGRSISGTLGYISASIEIYQQMMKNKMHMDYLVTPVGSSSTLGGLLIGKKLLHSDTKIIGISVSRKASDIKELILEQTKQFIKHFNLDISIESGDIEVYDSYIGAGYAIPTEKGIDAIKLLSKKESVFLDPTYTGKGMSGLVDLILNEYFKKNDNVMFLHTGGNPALFDNNLKGMI